MKISKILFAVDGSAITQKGIDLIAALGRGNKDLQVIILHVFSPNPITEYSLFQMSPESDPMECGRKAARQICESVKAELDKLGIANETRLEEGDVASEIRDVAGLTRCDMIVMGARGASDLEALFLGSVSHKVLNLVHNMPVLITR